MFKNNSKIKAIIIDEHYDAVKQPSECIYNQLMDCLFCTHEDAAKQILTKCLPDVIVTIGTSWESFTYIASLPHWIRRRWIHHTEIDGHEYDIFHQTLNNQMTGYNRPEVSIIMPLYNSKYLDKAYASICEQTCNDWELILIDDSPIDSYECSEIAKQITANDLRVTYHRLENQPTNGNIGLSKWRGACMSTGRFIFEMDHDDELYPWTLSMLCDAIKTFPFSGFFYSDFVDIDKDGNMIKEQYGNGYAFGFGKTYTIERDGQLLFANNSPNINSVTARHIVGMPNHFRCWSREIYFAVGGHNQYMRIADDYELCCKTLLATVFTRIQYPCYKQRFDGNNSQDVPTNREDIQFRVKEIAQFYNQSISKSINNMCGFDLYDDSIEKIYEMGANKQIPHCNNLYIPSM